MIRLTHPSHEDTTMPAETRLFACRSDNYGVLLHDPESGATASIDAPEAAPIESLLKLRDLPDDTRIFCGHEYTAANIKFARTIEPDNKALAAREAQATQQLAKGEPTIPVTIGEEKLANPFLRADMPEVAAGIGM